MQSRPPRYYLVTVSGLLRLDLNGGRVPQCAGLMFPILRVDSFYKIPVKYSRDTGFAEFGSRGWLTAVRLGGPDAWDFRLTWEDVCAIHEDLRGLRSIPLARAA
jgi:hypothetical protein